MREQKRAKKRKLYGEKKYADDKIALRSDQGRGQLTGNHLTPFWSHAEIRRFLNDFLFRKNEEIEAFVHSLSGGEKARLSLAQITVRQPQLLILDEMTNNLDLETRAYVIQVLQSFPGALMVVSHDQDFLKEINIEEEYTIKQRKKS